MIKKLYLLIKKYEKRELMKKKTVVLLMLTLALSGCGSAKNDTKQVSIRTETEIKETEEKVSNLEDIGNIDVDKNILTVEFTVPADYVNKSTQEELDKEAKEQGFNSITLNDDGSATYVMTKEKHKEMMKKMGDEINSSLSEMIQSNDYPNITKIEANEDFTNFTVTTTSSELDMNESISVMAFYMYGAMYSIFNGDDVDNIHVDFINADSGDIISSSDSSDLEDNSNLENDNEDLNNQVLSIGETWTVDGLWSLTINSISETGERNEYAENNPAQVFIVDYTYENLGYVDETGYMDGLFIELSDGQIVDSNGSMGYSYPGDTSKYPQETPVGANCNAQSCIAVDNKSDKIRIILNIYDANGNKHGITFEIPVE